MITFANRIDAVDEYYFSIKLKEVNMLISKGLPIVNMGIGNPDLLPNPSVIKALEDAITHPTAHQYQSYQGLPELRQAMCNFYKSWFNTQLNPGSEILPLMGSKEGILLASLAFLNKNDAVLVPNPGYPTYRSATLLAEATTIEYNLTENNNWLPNLAEIETQNLENIKIMWLNYPNMPTGAVATLTFFKEVIEFAKRHNILLIHDNPYSFINNSNPISITQIEGWQEVAIELNSLSKTFNIAGFRVGMAVGKMEYIQAILKVKSNLDSGMFYGIQKAACTALSLKNDYFIEQNKVYEKRKETMLLLLEKLNCKPLEHAAGMFVWAKIPNNFSTSNTFIDWLLYEKNIFATPGTVFGSNGEGYVRFSLCIDEQQIKNVINSL